MAHHWIPPPPGTLKINVHAINSIAPAENGRTQGIGAVMRNSVGDLKHITLGVINNLTPLGNQLWALYAPLRRAFLLGYRDIILETDNHEAFMVMKNFATGAPPAVFDLANQIDTLLRDRRWFCMLAYVYPPRNRVSKFAARLGMETGCRLLTFHKPVGGIEELLDWEMGL